MVSRLAARRANGVLISLQKGKETYVSQMVSHDLCSRSHDTALLGVLWWLIYEHYDHRQQHRPSRSSQEVYRQLLGSLRHWCEQNGVGGTDKTVHAGTS